MFDAQQKATGTGYTTIVALLTVAFFFNPAMLIILRPFGYRSLFLAIGCSVICIALAWVSWKKSSQLANPSVAVREAKAK